MLQKNLDPWWNLFWCFFFPAIVAQAAWGESFWTHRPYAPASNPAENQFVAVASLGEGWHNWHHKYPFDYAASEYGIASQFNPTKLIIDVAAACGMVYERKRATAMWAREKAKLQSSIKAKAG